MTGEIRKPPLVVCGHLWTPVGRKLADSGQIAVINGSGRVYGERRLRTSGLSIAARRPNYWGVRHALRQKASHHQRDQAAGRARSADALEPALGEAMPRRPRPCARALVKTCTMPLLAGETYPIRKWIRCTRRPGEVHIADAWLVREGVRGTGEMRLTSRQSLAAE